MSNDHEFRRTIEEIKLRAPIESIVGETVELKQKGGSLWACCPFHEERTPSFKVDVQQGTWYCFGACRKGGDVIRFVQDRGNMTFMDALEMLSAQTGVELPRRKPRQTSGNDPGLAALEFAEGFFRAELGREEGGEARRYLADRSFGQNAVDAFGLGWAPRNSRKFISSARRENISERALIDSGLARASEGNGELYSFFRGRVMIPIRDERGTAIAFGGRRLADADGPKYVNTSETRYFHKGRVIYALDRALESTRRSGHLVLVEGYTDVIAAHAAGMPNVGAVLGTATTDMHAALVRRAGTRRVSLVFDGDEAGRSAAWRGLEGLLPLDIQLEVVPMPEGVDPADILTGDNGAAAFAARLETGLPWEEFVADCVQAKRSEGGRVLALEVDRALELFLRLPRPVEIDEAAVGLARRLDIPADTIRGQLRSLDARRRRRTPAQRPEVATKIPPNRPLDPLVLRAYEELVGAALVDSGLIPRLRPWVTLCPVPPLGHLFQTLLDLWEHEDTEITVSLVLGALGAHSVRDQVAAVVEHARIADDPERLFQGAVEFLQQREQTDEIQRLQAQIQDLEPLAATDPGAATGLDHAFQRLLELQKPDSP